MWVLANALADLHREGFIHGDVKSQNLLLSTERSIKLCDFGGSRENSKNLKIPQFSRYWAAPEILQHEFDKNVSFGTAADIYSFGVVLTELAKGKIPYFGVPNNEKGSIKGKVKNGELRPTMNENCDKWIVDMANKYNLDQRPTANDLVTELNLRMSTALTASPPKRKLIEHLYLNGRVQKKALGISWIGVLLGFVWFLLHPVATITTGELKCRQTYFSENALLVDTVTSSIEDTQASWAKKYHRAYVDLEAVGDKGCSSYDTCLHIADWIEKQLKEIDGIEVYRQVYSEQLYENDEFVNRTNIYAILRAAPLADGKESVVLVAQYRNIPTSNKNGFSALAVGMAMLRHLGNVKWLAKDIILLLTDDGRDDRRYGHSPGVEAWLEAYHNGPHISRNPALEMHAGVIRAAINIETSLDSNRYNTVGVLGAGVNGQLPNLDLINTAVETLESEHIPIAMDRCSDIEYECHDDGLNNFIASIRKFLTNLLPQEYHGHISFYLPRLHHMLRFMQTLAIGPSGAHANFIRYNIDAITLSAFYSLDSPSTPLRLVSWLRSIETSVRAMSNLEEKLHQSFFFYLLVAPRSFVSIGEYYYVLFFFMLPLFASALYLITNTAGMRTAFAIISLITAEVFGLIVFGLMTHESVLDPVLTLTESHQQTISRTYGWTIVVIATLLQFFAVFVIIPYFHSHRLLQGNSDEGEWLIKIDDHRRTFKETQPVDPDTADDEVKEVPLEPFQRDLSGWKAIKTFVALMAIIIHALLGISNYAFTFVVTLPMTILIANAFPSKKLLNPLGRIIFGTILFATSPAVFLVILQSLHPNVIDGLAYLIHGYIHFGMLAVPYMCCIYYPIHTLVLWIWTCPPNKSAKEKVD
ncbi:transmembrane protein [Thraustotheca clavata]|uniref:Transmembrane protein n=1 Tax=Thraustotheca clavata TaxID=74557 RepID=A0A1W0A921_9STRA|nr:transmembrane protein [Thraustotheca clavata]